MFKIALLSTLVSVIAVTGPDDDRNTDKSMTAAAVSTTIAVDGVLSETDWDLVVPASNFRQYEPLENADPSQETEVRILYGENSIYVGATLYDSDPDGIFRPLGRRDDENKADWFYFAVDSHNDRKTAYVFAVSAAGVQRDGLLTENSRFRGGDNVDTSWDAVWDSEVRITPEGWVVEMRIPYSMLRFSDQETQTWGVNFKRIIARLGEVDEWVYIPRTEPSRISQFGTLTGLDDIQPKRNVQFLPYTVSSYDRYKDEDEGPIVNDYTLDAGADFKFGLSSNFTLDASFNPDFGQVEADPAELNLTTFETIFQERRPFFTEGSQIFDLNFGGREGALLYTRRIGSAAPIIGAAKVSGRTESGLSVGTLAAVTGDNFSPDRYYASTRLKKELGRYSTAGAGLSWFNTDDVDTNARQSLVGAADWDLRFSGNNYQLQGYSAYSTINYSDEQEDDQSGMALSSTFGKVNGNTTWGTAFEIFSDEFNPNDVGRLRQNNYIQTSLSFGNYLNRNQSFGPFRRAYVRLFGWHDWAFDDRTPLGIGMFAWLRTELKTFQELSLNVSTSGYGGYDNRETRDIDMLYRDPKEYSVRLEFVTDTRKTYGFEPTVRYSNQEGPGHTLNFELDSRFDLGTRVSLETGFDYGLSNRMISWASNELFAYQNGSWTIGPEDASDYEPEDLDLDSFQSFSDENQLASILSGVDPYESAPDRFYVPIFGERNRRSLEFSLRTNITFSPKLSFQLYSQLFVARGEYQNYSILSDPESLHLASFYPKRHDFDLKSFQSNAVLRWEYKPGSTLFVVWSQARGTSDFENRFLPSTPSPYGVATGSQIGDTFGLFPENVFLIKFNYLFMR